MSHIPGYIAAWVVEYEMSSWRRRNQLHEWLRSNPWVAPAAMMLLAIPLSNLLRLIDAIHRWQVFGFNPEGARQVLDVFIGSMLTFVVLVASSLLVVVQLASAQLTPRIILPVLRDSRIRVAFSLFILSYGVSLSVSGRISDQFVPQFTVAVAITINVISVIYFVYFVISLGTSLRPAHVLTRLAVIGHRVLTQVYPGTYDPSAPEMENESVQYESHQPFVIVHHIGHSGVLLAFDAEGLVKYAIENHAVIQIVPHVGEFVAAGDPLFKVHADRVINKDPLCEMIALGTERTLEQDPMLAIRNIVDIASKALSPAINDPTTAVLAIDQIHHLLRWVGERALRSGFLTDAQNHPRLLFPTPRWNQYVTLACQELRIYGEGSPRILRRLKAMIVHLSAVLPPIRQAALQDELRLIDASLSARAHEKSPAAQTWD